MQGRELHPKKYPVPARVAAGISGPVGSPACLLNKCFVL